MSSPAVLTVEAIEAELRQMERDHPRRFLVLCYPMELEHLQNLVEQMIAENWVRMEIEVRAHSFVKEGRCVMMRHPDDFDWHPRVELGVAAGGDQPSPS